MFCVFLGNANPPADLRSWFKCQGSGKTMDSSLAEFPHDIYAIGTQVQCVGCKVIFSDFLSFFEKQDMEIIINVHAIRHLWIAGHSDNSFVNIVKFKVL